MGDNFPIQWFGKSVTQLKQILEKEKLTEMQRDKLEKLIAQKENEEKQ